MDAFDHRSIGQRLDLFHFEEEGTGMVVWHPKGRVLCRLIEDQIRRRMKAAGFQKIETPQNPARALVRDDAQLLCCLDQVVAEVKRFSQLLRAVYRDFGFVDFGVGLATRPRARMGSEEIWDAAERVLQSAARAAGLDYVLRPGEGAIYGPKLEFILQDRLGRRWPCGTVQLDLVLRDQPRADCIYEEGADTLPIMLHYTVLGSLERFIGMLLEHWRGRLPLWLAPEQVLVAAVSDQLFGYAEEAAIQLEADGFRVAIDAGNETLTRKIAGWRERGIPILALVGAREAEKARVNLRTLVDDVRAELPLREAACWIKRVAARNGAAATMPS